MQTLGLYLSIPFCKSKCTYCNFASGVYPASQIDGYITRVIDDLRAMRSHAAEWGTELPEIVDTVYLGGGTPSLLSAEQLSRLFSALRREFVVLPASEITVECAPGQLEDASLASMAENGVNRISFGVQSFIDAEAKHSGRLHTREMALADLNRVRSAGISRLSLDLIAGLPGQTAGSWQESLEVLGSTGVDHASVYMLEVDDDSRLGREVNAGGFRYYAPQVPTDEAITDMYEEATGFLEKLGLQQYEISNFARKGRESRHNLKYWDRKPYLGLGLDAHSMLRAEDGAAMRFATTDELPGYMEAPSWQPRRLAREEELEETWFLGLRRNAGVNLRELAAQFGEETVREIQPTLVDLECEDLIVLSGSEVRLTARGRMVSNEVFERFLATTPVS
ncbi:radical SAM family heme chaperone HemW [Silvibacterium acidisoli]|uniref:radical SAM family heme chaperone HemW n=1 Tax=Acidobacteriaceae bacterium ZG23-2 TaxID=2883246 RepID=UPI00406BE64E